MIDKKVTLSELMCHGTFFRFQPDFSPSFFFYRFSLLSLHFFGLRFVSFMDILRSLSYSLALHCLLSLIRVE